MALKAHFDRTSLLNAVHLAANSPNYPSSSFPLIVPSLQEARRASERAEGVMRVDDRVSKAVAAANRAATAARVASVKANDRGSLHASDL